MLPIQIIIFILGLSIGSFLNVCIYRIPEKKSIAYPASHCPHCKHNLSAVDLIPVLGYVMNRGKCKYCGAKISMQYPVVELITAVVFLLLFNKSFLSIEFIKYAVLTCMLIIVTFVDLERQEIPDEIILFGLVAGLIFNLFDIKANMLSGIIGFVLGGGIFLLIAMLTNGAMGGGDIKLMAVLGLFLGWKFVLILSLLSFVIGAVVSLILIVAKVKGPKDYIPFGPFIAISALIVIFFGAQMVQLYVQNLLI
jgi:leader peptidase (prepilin peptidase)/N-methyltransferase